MVGIATEKVVAEFVAGFQDLGEAEMIINIGFDGKVKEFEGAVDGFVGAGLIAFLGPFERAGYFAADIAHLVSDRTSEPILAGGVAVDVV